MTVKSVGYGLFSVYLESIGNGAFSYTGFSEIILPDTVKEVEPNAFRSDKLISLTFGSGLENIAVKVCEESINLTTVDLGNVKEIGTDAFFNCSSLKTVVWSDYLTTIGPRAFANCDMLTLIEIPESVTSIDWGAFSQNSEIEVYFYGDAPNIHQYAFQYTTGVAYYPINNETWTEDVKQNYGGTLTWVPYCAEHNYVAVTTPANCIQDGFTTYTCTYCQDTYTGDYVYATGQHTYADDTDTDCDICGNVRDLAMPTTPMYRMYNPNSGEHFYTGSLEEREGLIAVGWAYEGIAWNAPTNSGASVYRLYNPNSGDHHYTMSAEERDMLVDVGWQYEGVCWNSATPDNLPLYRLYNPNADCGSHHYTGSTEERDFLVSVGWHYEGIGWFGMLR